MRENLIVNIYPRIVEIHYSEGSVEVRKKDMVVVLLKLGIKQ